MADPSDLPTRLGLERRLDEAFARIRGLEQDLESTRAYVLRLERRIHALENPAPPPITETRKDGIG